MLHIHSFFVLETANFLLKEFLTLFVKNIWKERNLCLGTFEIHLSVSFHAMKWIHTVKIRSNHQKDSVWSKMTISSRAWHGMKVLPRPSHCNSTVTTYQGFQNRHYTILNPKGFLNGQRSNVKVLRNSCFW